MCDKQSDSGFLAILGDRIGLCVTTEVSVELLKGFLNGFNVPTYLLCSELNVVFVED